MTRQIWQTLAEPNWTKDSRGWDFSFNCLLQANPSLKILQPKWSRSIHIGREGGTHCTPDYHDKTFGHLTISDGYFRDYRMPFQKSSRNLDELKIRPNTLSIIMPYYKKYDDFSKVLPLNHPYLNKPHIEVILSLDEDTETDQLLPFLDNYSDIQWKVIVCHEKHEWRPPSKAINVGLRHATGDAILIVSPESAFVGDLPTQMLAYLALHPGAAICGRLNWGTFGELETCRDLYTAMLWYHTNLISQKRPQFYGSISVSRQQAMDVCGFDECFTKWGGDDDNFRQRLKLACAKILLASDVNIVHLSKEPRKSPPREYSKQELDRIHRPPSAVCSKCSSNWGKAFNDMVRSYEKRSAGSDNRISRS